MSEPIILYDIPYTGAARSFSPNTWKTRYCLNIKRIPYTTIWVEFPDIAPLCQHLNAPPSETRRDDTPSYTLPVIYDPHARAYISGSDAIAAHLDRAFPDTPRLVLTPAEERTAGFPGLRACARLLFAPDVLAVVVPAVWGVLNEASRPYFRVTREKRFGCRLEDVAPKGSEARARHWEGVQGVFHTIAGWYEAAEGGKGGRERLLLMGGERVCYVDVSVAGSLMWIRAIFGEESEEWRDVAGWDGGRWGRFMATMRKYEFVDAGQTMAKL